MQFKHIAFFAIIPLLVFVACDSKNKTEEKIKYPKISLTTVKGGTLELITSENTLAFTNYQNKALLINFFATWCPPCKAEFPHLNKLREKYKNDFEIINVLLSDKKSKEEMLAFLQEFNIQYPTTNGQENELFAQYLGGIKTIPTMYLVKKGGFIMEKYKGIVPEEMLESDIQRAIK